MIQKSLKAQRDFSAGQIDTYSVRRDDTKILSAACRLALNARPMEIGGLTRRPGRRILYFDGGICDRVRPVGDTDFDIIVAAGRFTARLAGGGVTSEIINCPWTAAMLPDLSVWWVGLEIYVAHRRMQTQIVTYDPDAGTWSLSKFDFRKASSGEVLAPFYRFADLGVTMKPSDLTGSITVTFNAPVLKSSMVGVVLRYVNRQMKITAVSTKRIATATVIQDLPPSNRLTVDDIKGYSIGDVIEGDTTNTRAEVVDIDKGAGTLDVVLMTNLTGFESSEFAVGPNARGKITHIIDHPDGPQPTVQWDEQFISTYRGWPGSVTSDRQRLIFCDFTQLPSALAWSAINSFTDFKITGNADDAILETLPYPGRILYVLGGADEFVFCDTGVFFIPISSQSPLAPGSVEFRRVSAEGVAQVRPIPTADGAAFVTAKQRIHAITATGALTRPYQPRPLTDLHLNLFSNPVALALASGTGRMNGPHLYVVNDDGSVVVGRYDPASDWMGWFPWDNPNGRVTGITGRFDELIVAAEYDQPNGTVQTVEEYDDALIMDGCVELGDRGGTDPITLSTGVALQLSTGAQLDWTLGALSEFAGDSVFAIAGADYLGPAAVDDGGHVSVFDGEDATSLITGFPFDVHVQPFIENFEGGQDVGQRKRRRKVSKVLATVRDTQLFSGDGRKFAGWRVGEDQGAGRPGRDDTFQWRQSGRSWDPIVDIVQTVPGTFNLLELAVEVTI